MKKIDNIKKLTKEYEKEWGIFYADNKSTSYNVFRVIFAVFAVFAAIMGAFAEIGQKIVFENAEKVLIESFNIDFYFVLISCLLLISAVVLIFFKKTYISFVLTLIPAIYQLLFFKNLMTGANMTAGINIDYWWRHFIPLVIAVFCILVDLIIEINANLKFNRHYNEVMKKIFVRFKDKHKSLSDEDWQKFLESYHPDSFLDKKEKTGF